MSSLKTILWITLVPWGILGKLTLLYKKQGEEVIIPCVDKEKVSSDSAEWKFNNGLIIKQTKSGAFKGSLDLSSKIKMNGDALRIPSVKMEESGLYTCFNGKKNEYRLQVVSVFATPSNKVLVSHNIELTCNTGVKSQATVQWLKPPDKEKYGTSGNVISLKNVTQENAGNWTCEITDGKEKFEVDLGIIVVGPLTSAGKVVATHGGIASLTCCLQNPGGMSIVGGSWAPKNQKQMDLQFPKLIRDIGDLKWGSLNISSRVKYGTDKLNANFTVTLTKVKTTDEGMYICTLDFEGGNKLTAELELKVDKSSDVTHGGQNMNKTVLGVKLWVWVAAGTASFLLIVLIVIVILVHRRNKHMRRKVRKLKSMRQPLTPRNFCQCDRTAVTPRPAGRKERPPPLPRYQYDIVY